MESNQIKGTLIPIGGNEDKGHDQAESYSMDFIEEGILSHVVKEAGGTDALIIVIPTASSIPIEVGDNYLNAFDKLGCNNVRVLNLRDREEADDHVFTKWIEKADCVMFSGGDQSRITKKIGHTIMHRILKDRYLNEDFVIAGTSAGAMMMSEEMITGGSASESLFKGAVSMAGGMGFIPDLIIDSHFIQRGRFGRLAEAVARYPHLLGVGLSEDTGLVIKGGNEFKVIGSGMVIMFDPAGLTHNNEDILDQGIPMTLVNLTTHVLSNSDGFIIDERRVTILPVDADFI